MEESSGIELPVLTSRRSSTSSGSVEIPLLAQNSQPQRPVESSLPRYRDTRKDGSFGLNFKSPLKGVWRYAKDAFQLSKPLRNKGGRRIQIDIKRMKPLVDVRSGQSYTRNSIRSNKYTPLTFLPRQLIAQFSKLANFYLLCFAILQLVPGLSTIGNKTNIVPLMIFVSISMAKEGFDDYRRHRLDQKENRRETRVINTAVPLVTGALNWRKAQWQNLHVGDIVNIKRDEPIPADIILLSSKSLTDSNVAYVETIALDGETDLKRKLTVKSIAEVCAAADGLLNCSIGFIAEDPNPNLSTFKGRVCVNGQTSVLNNDHIIYRGSILRNTSEILAMIVYSGEECKIRMDRSGKSHARTKAPLLQSKINWTVAFVVCLVVGISVYNTVAYQSWKSEVETKLFYLSAAAVPLHQEIFGFVIMLATMVPLSLYISMEMIKLAQIYFLNTDIDMYDEQSNTPFEARTSTINEDLGQVTHIFSDKTGTLTDNVMKFKKLYVARTEWVFGNGKDSHGSMSGAERNTEELIYHICQKPYSAFAQSARLMLLCMALCHTCVPEKTKHGSGVDFQASSPDELALVRAAQHMGFLMRSRNHDTVTMEFADPTNASIRTEAYEILDNIEFSNDRKRMSVIVRFPDGRICIICKGADSVIIERLRTTKMTLQEDGDSRERIEHVHQNRGLGKVQNSRSSTSKDDEDGPLFPDDIEVADRQAVIEDCILSVNRFANESLRTLLYAYRFLDDREFRDWKEVWDEAIASEATQGKTIEEAAGLIETDFELSGATGIEDKLQQGVPESIDKLCRASIKIWMLTGDKKETAINIGHSCGLIRKESTIFTLDNEAGPANLSEIITSNIAALAKAAHSVVVIDGHTLATIYDDPSGSLGAAFFDLAMRTDSVICCRAQPVQKAQLVGGVKKRLPDSVTLAVGDGANDIAMIQEAHIGIGITGKEGFQAARSSDYSIAQFRFLQKLLLVHGRWNYVRTCKYVLGTLWKEVVFFLPQALFQRWNGFTGTSFYEPWTLAQFNTLFTSLPVMVFGIFEKDLTASTLLAVPELYRTMGQSNGAFGFLIYSGWTIMAVVEATIIFFSILTLFGNAEVRTRDNTLFPMGDLSFVAAVMVTNLKMQGIETYNKTIVAAISIFLEVGAAFLWNMILAAAYPQESIYKARGAFFLEFGRNPTWWLTLIFIVVCVYLFECTVSVCRRTLFPTDTDTFQEQEYYLDLARKNQAPEAGANLKWRENWVGYKDESRDAVNEIDIPMRELPRNASSSRG